MAANSVVCDGKFELIKSFMHVLVTCSNEEDPIKHVYNISPIIKIWGFFKTIKGSLLCSSCSDLAEFQLVRDVMDVLVICKNQEDPIKKVGARVLTTFSPL